MKEMEEFLARKKDFYHHPEKYLVEPFRIIGNLYFIGNKDVSSYLLDTGDGLMILDTGYPTTQGLLVYSIMALGFRIEDIRMILHTYGHFDHIGGTALLKTLSHARTYLGWRDARMFEKQPELSLKEFSGCPYFTLFTPDRLMRDGDKIYEEKVDVNLGNHTDQNSTLEKWERMRGAAAAEGNPFVEPLEWRRFLDGVKRRYGEMVSGAGQEG